MISVWGMPRSPIAGSRLPMIRPGVPLSARKPPIPCSSPRSSNTRAKIRWSLETPPPVIQCFLPRMTYVLPCLSARHLGRGRSGFRFGDADRRLVARKNEISSHPLLLLGAVLHDRGDGAHVGLDRNAPRRPAYPRHFLDDQGGLEITSSSTAVGCRNCIAHEARGLQSGHVVERVGFGSVDFRRLRRE